MICVCYVNFYFLNIYCFWTVSSREIFIYTDVVDKRVLLEIDELTYDFRNGVISNSLVVICIGVVIFMSTKFQIREELSKR